MQLSLNNVYSITIYHLSPTLWKRKDPALIELLTKEIVEVHFEVAFVMEVFCRTSHWQENEKKGNH